jgi:hypothetical protein
MTTRGAIICAVRYLSQWDGSKRLANVSISLSFPSPLSGVSRHGLLRNVAFAVAIGGKADITAAAPIKSASMQFLAAGQVFTAAIIEAKFIRADPILSKNSVHHATACR